ncbi:hypothetical protein NL676_033117 [Syzygium grande]|nr:hypothetical protein NL676_033117 [Syzygium grande]
MATARRRVDESDGHKQDGGLTVVGGGAEVRGVDDGGWDLLGTVMAWEYAMGGNFLFSYYESGIFINGDMLVNP